MVACPFERWANLKDPYYTKRANQSDSVFSWNRSFKFTMKSTLLLATLFVQFLKAECKCSFPEGWKGRWFQSGLGEVIIREHVINQKGACYEHHRDYFLLENREKECFQCLLLIKRHKNIIQYKESFCIERDTLRSVCNHIRIETPLYTLVREPSGPTRCPFQDAYYFNYNDHVSGFCAQPISYAKPCVGQNKFQFHFKHCDEHAMWNGKDLDFDCLATWKDGSEMYMYGRFAGPGISSKDDSYKCFLYQYYGSEIYLSMSVDATCRGLRTARDGPFVMELKKDIYGWPPPSCQFPNWLTGRKWRDVEGKHSYVSDENGEVILGFYRRRVNARRHLHNEYKCVEVLDFNQYSEEYTLLSFATHACLSKHQCIKLKRKGNDVIELYKGNMVDYESNNQCLVDEEYKDVQILIPENLEPVGCPQPGLYQVETPNDCIQHLNVGCENKSRIEMQSSCKNSNVYSLECLATWPGDSRTYFIVRQPGKDTRLVNCFSIREFENNLEIGTDKQCNEGISNLLDGAVTHSLVFNGQCKNGVVNTELVVETGSPTEVEVKERPLSSNVFTTKSTDEYSVQASTSHSPHNGKGRPPSKGREEGVTHLETSYDDKFPSIQSSDSIVNSQSNSSSRKFDVNYNKVEEMKGYPDTSQEDVNTSSASWSYICLGVVLFCFTLAVSL